MQILIVDDEELARVRLRRLLDSIDGCEVIGEARDGNEAIEAVYSLDPELVFLDIRMPELDGLSVAKQLAELDDPPAMIFCTAFDEYAVEAFDTLAQGYLVKPVDLEQLQHVVAKIKKITKVQRRVGAEAQTKAAEPSATDATSNLSVRAKPDKRRTNIAAGSTNKVEMIAVESIFCFVADQKYVTVIHSGGETLIDDTLKELEQEFGDLFIRVHRNSLVCIEKIRGLERNTDGHMEVCLRDCTHRPTISRRHLPIVKAELATR